MAEPVVYIVDDDAAVRQAVGLLLRSVGLMSLPFDSGQAFLDHWHEDQPGCLLLDIRMPGMSGLELQTRLAANPLAPPVLFITGHGDVSMAVRAMREGAVDFIEKPFNDQTLLERVQRALNLDAENRVVVQRRRAAQARLATLTPREHEVLEAIVTGKANKVIALDLGLSERTVEIHRSRVMDKTGVASLAELVTLIVELRNG